MSVLFYAIHPILPANPVQLPLEERSPLVHFLPQGWAFFTRDPNSLNVSAFTRDANGQWQAALVAKRFWPHILNFSRSWKMPGVEVGMLLSELPGAEWQKCEELPTQCLDKIALGGSIENRMPQPIVCGETGFVRQPPVPWAWRKAARETVMPSEVLRLQVSCHE